MNLSTPTVSGATYLWSGPNGFTSTAQNPSIYFVTTAASGTYTVTNTVAGCTSRAGSTDVTVHADVAPPVVTAPAPRVVVQSLCCGVFGGTSGGTSRAVSTFLAGGSATDDCDPSPARLTPQVSQSDVSPSTCLEGSVAVRFRFRDAAGNVGWTESSLTVRMFGDLNLDGAVDPTDMVVLRAYFNFAATPGVPPFAAPIDLADLTHDGYVDPSDLVMLRAYFNFAVSCLAP